MRVAISGRWIKARKPYQHWEIGRCHRLEDFDTVGLSIPS